MHKHIKCWLAEKNHINLPLSLEKNVSCHVLIKEHVGVIGEGWRRVSSPILWKSDDDSHFARAG